MISRKIWTTFVAGAFTLTSLQAAALTGARELRIEQVPAGTEWIAGHGQVHFPSVTLDAPKRFSARHGAAWLERRHGPGQAFRSIYGEGIAVAAEVMSEPKVAVEVAQALFASNPELLPAGVSARDLKPWSNELAQGMRMVSFEQHQQDWPVLGASAFVVFKRARLVMIGVRLFPSVRLSLGAQLSPGRAAELAQQALAQRGVSAQAAPPRAALFPRLSDAGVKMVPVYEVELRAARRGRWTAFVAAGKGELLALRDERRFVGAEVSLQHHDRIPSGGLTASPASHLQVETTGGNIYTSADGHFSAAEAASGVNLELRGRYARVINLAGAELSTRFDTVVDGSSLVWSSDGSEEQQAQIDAYRFVTEAREHGRALAPEVSWLDRVLRVNVNYDDVCNAWFDGELTFLQAGEYQGVECNNSAMIADIVYHEFGHGFHMASAVAGMGGIDDASSEGFADYFSASITGDPQLAPEFELRGGPLRDLRPDLVYPDHVSYDPHVTGLILAGALWDLRTLLQEELGEEEGAAVTDSIFAGMMKIAGDVASTYEAALLADDDNGNLADGTPHVCAIDAAFGAHGLKSDAVAVLKIAHEQVTRVAPGEPISIQAQVAVTNPQCSDAGIGAARIVFSSDGGASWSEQTLGRDGDSFAGEITAPTERGQLLYRIEVDEPRTGTVVSRPNNRAEPYFVLYVGALEPVVCDDFETAVPGWDHELIAGSNIEGADDWQRDTPRGVGGDPDHAYSGLYAWGNDLAPEAAWNGQYQSNKRNRLNGPVWDLAGHERVRLQFRRWLTVEDGRYDHARVIVNDQMVWHNAIAGGDLHHLDREWVLVDIDVSEHVAGSETLQVRFELESDDGLEFGGWTIDDVCVMAEVLDPDPDPGLSGSGGDAQGDETLGGGNPGRLIGCGCAQTQASGGALGLLLLALLVLRRRR